MQVFLLTVAIWISERGLEAGGFLDIVELAWNAQYDSLPCGSRLISSNVRGRIRSR